MRLTDFQLALAQTFPGRLWFVGLQGSRARGEAHEGSRRRYRSRLQLTQEGRLAAAQMAGIVDEKLQSVSGGISEEELAVFYRVLDLIVERLEAL